MGKFKTTSKKCPLCTAYFVPKDSTSRVSIRFRMSGQDLNLCPDCEGRKRFETVAWLAKEQKELRTIPQYDPKTRKRTLVILTDPKDYEGEHPLERGLGDTGMLLSPTEANLAAATKEIAGA